MIRRIALVLCLSAVTAAAIDSNEKISYQGRLVNGTNLVFRNGLLVR